MKPFNLEEYLANPNKKLVTRDGRKVTRILCTDAKGEYPIIALIKSKNEKEEYPLRYVVNGQYCPGYEKQEDLFFATEKHEGWINIFKFDFGNAHTFLREAHIYSSKEDAENKGKSYSDYLSTIKIEWEE